MKTAIISIIIFISCISTSFAHEYVNSSDIVSVQYRIRPNSSVSYYILVARRKQGTSIKFGEYVSVSKECYFKTLSKLGSPIYTRSAISVKLY
jgi:hypothetical protein